MLNLLPKEDKKVAQTEYRRRLWSVILMMVFIMLVSGVLVLVPSLIKVESRIKKATSDFDILSKKPAANDYRDLENIIKGTKVEIDVLIKQNAAHSEVADKIKRVLKNRPWGIRIENIAWLKDEKEEEMVISGRASNRDLLNKYFKVLSSDSSFSKVSLPISDFAKSEDAQFSITINLSKSLSTI